MPLVVAAEGIGDSVFDIDPNSLWTVDTDEDGDDDDVPLINKDGVAADVDDNTVTVAAVGAWASTARPVSFFFLVVPKKGSAIVLSHV